jgi:hypothetical protein
MTTSAAGLWLVSCNLAKERTLFHSLDFGCEFMAYHGQSELSLCVWRNARSISLSEELFDEGAYCWIVVVGFG